MNLPEIIVPIVTPCSQDGIINKEEFQIVCNDLQDVDCSGFFIASSTGRGPWFTLKQRTEICLTARDYLNSSSVIAAGCMGTGLPAMLENAYVMKDFGADIAVITAPVYYDYSTKEIETLFMTFADLSPLPVMIYDIPSFTRVKLNRDMIFRLAQHENIIGLKDSTGDAVRFYDMLDNLPQKEYFYLYQGKERYLKESLSRGADGFVVSMIQLYPSLFTGLYNAVKNENMKRADIFQNTINQIMTVVENSFTRRPEISTLFHILERVFILRGIDIKITLDHEGDIPLWLAENATQIYTIAKSEI